MSKNKRTNFFLICFFQGHGQNEDLPIPDPHIPQDPGLDSGVWSAEPTPPAVFEPQEPTVQPEEGTQKVKQCIS